MFKLPGKKIITLTKSIPAILWTWLKGWTLGLNSNKRRNTLTFLSVITILTALFAMSAVAFAQPQSYRLICRGGPSMRIKIFHDFDRRNIPTLTRMIIYFQPSSNPGNVLPPGPGECVWFDRTFRRGEPTTMLIESPRIGFGFVVRGDGSIDRDAAGPLFVVENAHWSSEAQDWQYLVDGVMQGRIFIAHVYNEGDTMVITQVEP